MSKIKQSKLYAYSDNDGFIHFNILKGQAIWKDGQWLQREEALDKAKGKEKIFIALSLVLGMAAVYGAFIK